MILNGNPKREKTTKVVSFINKLFFGFSYHHMLYATFTKLICDISHMLYLTLQNAYAIYRIHDTFSRTLALCLGSGYSERTINNAYAFALRKCVYDS